jgi:hypothetical protein
VLHGERERLRPVLGDAAYRDDEEALSILRTRMHELDDAVAACEQSRVEAVARARARVDDARVAVQPTEVIAPEENGSERES